MSKYELNRTIKLNNDSEYPSLYSWSLEEYDSEGNKVGLEFITQQIGSIYLNVERLAYINGFNRGEYDDDSSEFRESEDIYGTLTPNNPHLPSWRQNTFSMFGADREVKHFGLEIRRTDDGESGDSQNRYRPLSKGLLNSKQESCYMRGFVGYKEDGGLDIEPHEAEDSLFLRVYLNEERFNKIVQHIKNGTKARHIRLGHVDGFYNVWTPSIHLESIKILSDDTSGYGEDERYVQQIDMPKKSDITPPRLGKVYDFDIVFEIESNILINDDKENEDVYKDDYEIDNPVKLESSTDVISSQLSQISDLGLKLSKLSLDALRLPLWIIAITLLLILIYK